VIWKEKSDVKRKVGLHLAPFIFNDIQELEKGSIQFAGQQNNPTNDTQKNSDANRRRLK
jgi:hypothetical protein